MELTKNYDPASVETKWITHWKKQGHFNSVPDSRKPFTIVIPPPNVTGVLHMGHTLNETVQDILVRHARMNGYNACWVPGSDHASIATEAKVVEMLKREKHIDKFQISREEFLAYAFQWKEKYGNIIYNQIERLGCSVDWNRVAFTMDPDYYRAVMKVFTDLYDKGLIYRGARMINWDPIAKTALSDEEVEHRDIAGKLYHVKYFVVDSPSAKLENLEKFITIATQRPETIMGDTAVAVNPNDERYKPLHGKFAVIPFVNRIVPIITDDYIDPQFGTGVLKVTPAHDINDYNIGLKHNLAIIDTLNEDGTLTEAAGPFAGLERFDARKKVVAALKENEWLLKEEEYQTRAGFSQRTNCVVEPRISTQWFLNMRALAEKALQPVLDGRIKIHPEERFLNTYKYWLSNIKDWCISRQLWWGQRIPAWYDADGNFVVAENENDAKQLYLKKFNKSAELKQDEDVLDTWFSSWLWPMEVFKGVTDPGNKDFNYYYPTSVLVTGQDIIFFWVARMIMAGMEYKNEVPFKDVYFTGMVRDKQGRKMSKQLGNSPDLLELIAKYGADAVRFGIMVSAPAGNDLLFDESSPDQGKFFNNKIWNAMKLLKMWKQKLNDPDEQTADPSGQDALVVMDVSGFAGSIEPGDNDEAHTQISKNDFAVQWFASRLAEVKDEVERLYAGFKLSEALKTIYSLIWDDFCSWYLEWVKPPVDQKMDQGIYRQSVKFFTELMHMLHPFMPFITEEIYHLLAERKDDLCVRQPVSYAPANMEMLKAGNLLKEVITGLRDARNKSRIKLKDEIKLYVITGTTELYKSFYHILAKQVNANTIAFNTEAIGHNVSVVIGKDKFFLETSAEIDNSEQREGMMKELQHLEGFLSSVNKKLSNEKFMQNAKPEVVALEEKKKSDAEAKIRIIRESLASL
ncbi:MAG: valine--tRNA ligase [Chitinophagaceae bacterium]|nr:valine--tRNA ligase [Chitinophagaceae bacterium]